MAEETADALVYDGPIEEGLAFANDLSEIRKSELKKKKKKLPICKLCYYGEGIHCGLCDCCPKE